MEAAIRAALVTTFEDYAYGLEKADTSSFPILMRDLQLKPAKVNEDLEDTPFVIEEGRIGMIRITPGWMGNVEIEASGIKLNLAFSPVKAAKLAMKPDEYVYNNEEIFLTGAHAPRAPPPPVNVPPRFCTQHDTSEKRFKTDPHPCSCILCGISFTSTYAEVSLCAACSEKEKRCLICGAGAGKAGSYIPNSTCSPCSRPDDAGPGGNENSAHMRRGPPPGGGGPNKGNDGSMMGGDRAASAPWKDLYGHDSNLKPSESMPVQNPSNRGPPTMPPTPQQAMRQQPNSRGEPMMQQRPNPPRGPPNAQNMGRGRGMGRGSGRPQQQQPLDDNPFAGFMRQVNCAITGMFDNDEEDNFNEGEQVRPGQRRPPMGR